ncbi:MAG: TRAP transporter permease, partial [Pseudomonadota bacterium]
MTDSASQTTTDQVIAEGVDDEPVEGNRRLFTGRSYLLIAALAAIYAAFHMIALNGVSISDYTGVEIGFLPQFPLETWNFRIVHIAGALALGFVLYSAHTFRAREDDRGGSKIISIAAALLIVPALVAGVTAVGFVQTINSGTLPQMGGLTTWAAFPGTDIYASEVYWFGIPLLIASLGAVLMGWFEKRDRAQVAASDIVLAVCAGVVAIYFTAIYGTAARNSVGTPFVPIGVAFAATAGSAMILELTRRVAGLALVIITGVFLVYTFTAHLLPGILAVQSAY